MFTDNTFVFLLLRISDATVQNPPVIKASLHFFMVMLSDCQLLRFGKEWVHGDFGLFKMKKKTKIFSKPKTFLELKPNHRLDANPGLL